MSNSTKAVIPEGTTHRWSAGGDTKLGPVTLRRLTNYKFEDGCWWVYGCTGWRKSCNDDAWFTREIIEGFFVPI